ncbi:hypothetical protein PTKIN_Ptkin11bG0154100 [Pterospermum kingtungense]
MSTGERWLFEILMEKKRQRERCEFAEGPKRQKVEDEDEVEDEYEYEYECEGDFPNYRSAEEDGYEDYSENEARFVADVRGQCVFTLPTNDAVDELCKSFYYADILPPDQVRARIKEFLKLLPDETKDDEAFVRVSKVLKICNRILSDEKHLAGNRVPRRALFCMLVHDSGDYFSSQLQVNRAIQDAVALLRCSSFSLGIMEYGRGVVAGRILMQEPSLDGVDCFAIGNGFSTRLISSNLKLLERSVMRTDARYIIVVEKDAIFERLASDGVFKQNIPSILLTAKGYPDTATRFLLRRLSWSFPHLPILALVDWKPAGLAALSAYKFGSIGIGLEAYGHGTFLQFRQFAPEGYGYACNVKWLGLRGDDLEKERIPERCFSPLKGRDLQIAESLISSEILPENYRKQLELMMQRGVKVHIEALFYHGSNYLGKYIAQKIEQADYI